MNINFRIINKVTAIYAIEKELDKIANNNLEFKNLILQLEKLGDLFILGGFIRDISQGDNFKHHLDGFKSNNNIKDKKFRDIDFITSLDSTKLLELVTTYCSRFKVNHLGGIKIIFADFTMDIWALRNNWAFTKNISNYNIHHKLESLANGSFLNFDSIVFDFKSKDIYSSLYNKCIRNNTIDIIKTGKAYLKYSKPKSAILLRCYFLRTTYKFELSGRLCEYLFEVILSLMQREDSMETSISKLLSEYPKYRSGFDWHSYSMFMLYVNFKKNIYIAENAHTVATYNLV